MLRHGLHHLSASIEDSTVSNFRVPFKRHHNSEDSQWTTFKNYVYDPNYKTLCGRTPHQLVFLLLYYVIYLIFIVGLFFGFLYAIRVMIEKGNPDMPMVDKDTLKVSLEPGLGFIPNIIKTKYPIIWYSPDPSELVHYNSYVSNIRKFLRKYHIADKSKYENCTDGVKPKKLCYFDIGTLDECGKPDYYYTNSSLCFYLKLNKLKTWVPDCFENSKSEIFPDQMSQSIIDTISSSKNSAMVHVECHGLKAWDNQFYGDIEYYPRQGFPSYHFPYNGEKEYLSPLIAVKLSNITTGVVINMECTAWAKNIGLRLNHVTFKIFVDSTLPT